MSFWYLLLVTTGVGLICLELQLRRRSGRPVDVRDARLSLIVGAISYGLGLVTQLAFVALSFVLVTNVAPWQLPVSSPLVWIAFFVIDDLVNYVVHVAEHRIPILWAAHSVHHSTEDLNFVAALRLSPVEALYQPMLVLWAPLVGVPLAIYAPLTVVALAIGQLQHTQLVGRLRWLDPWLATPSNHRVHHGSNPNYLDKNFGSSLMIWDRIFGTYEREDEPVTFGLAGSPLPPGVIGTVAGLYPAMRRARRPSLPPLAGGQPDNAGAVLLGPQALGPGEGGATSCRAARGAAGRGRLHDGELTTPDRRW